MRAYVYTELAMIKYPPQNPDRSGVGFEVKNTGATWARNLVIRKAMIPRDLTIEYDPWTRARWDATDYPIVLGPGQSLGLQLKKFGYGTYPLSSRRIWALILPFGSLTAIRSPTASIKHD
jgi:hypothetical protein